MNDKGDNILTLQCSHWPPSWQKLANRGFPGHDNEERAFYPDLVGIANQYLLSISENQEWFSKDAEAFMELVGIGFEAPFNRKRLSEIIREGEWSYEVPSEKMLDALEELSSFFKGRISNLVWDCCALLSIDPKLRHKAREEILGLPETDLSTDSVQIAVLNAVSKTSALHLYVQSCFLKHGQTFVAVDSDTCSFDNTILVSGIMRVTGDFRINPVEVGGVNKALTRALLKNMCQEWFLAMIGPSFSSRNPHYCQELSRGVSAICA